MARSDPRLHLAILMHHYVQDCDIRGLEKLLEHKDADPNVIMPELKFSPFHGVAGSQNEDFAVEAVKLFLKSNGDPNVRADEQLTPVHVAASWGHAKVLKVLLEGGGSPWLKDSENKTSFDYAIENGHTHAIKTIEEYSERKETAGNEISQKLLTRLRGLQIKGKTVLESKCVSTSSTMRSTVIENDTKTTESDSDSDESIIIIKEILSENTRSEASMPCYSDSLNSFVNHERFFQRRSMKNTHGQLRPRMSVIRQSLMPPAFIVPEIIVSEVSSDVIEDSLASSSKHAMEGGDNAHICQQLGTTVCKKQLGTTVCKKQLVNDWINSNVPTASTSSYQSYTTCPNDVTVTDLHNTAAVASNLKVDSSCDDSATSFVTVSECFKYTDLSEGIVLLEERWPGTNYVQFPCGLQTDISSDGTSQTDTKTCDTDSLRKELEYHGIIYGPITTTTKQVYVKQLKRQKKLNRSNNSQEYSYSYEVCRSLKERNSLYFLECGSQLEEVMSAEFSRANPGTRWREGHLKTSFTYLLLDPRITRNLPCRAQTLPVLQVWATFLQSIFYIGKGMRSRPYFHLYEAVQKYNSNKIRYVCWKVKRIVEIWKEECGVVCLHVFQNVIPVEAYTREAAMIDALGLKNLTNIKRGEYYGKAARWSSREKKICGTYLLYKSLQIFLSEGERQLRICDVA